MVKKKRQVKVVTLVEEQKRILQACHSEPTSGHFGKTKTWRRVAEWFCWKSLANDVRTLVSLSSSFSNLTAWVLCYNIRLSVLQLSKYTAYWIDTITFSIQVQHCPTCQRMNKKIEIEKPELHPDPVKAPWCHMGMDFVGLISPSAKCGNRYILTTSDYFTVWMETANIVHCVCICFLFIPNIVFTANIVNVCVSSFMFSYIH